MYLSFVSQNTELLEDINGFFLLHFYVPNRLSAIRSISCQRMTLNKSSRSLYFFYVEISVFVKEQNLPKPFLNMKK